MIKEVEGGRVNKGSTEFQGEQVLRGRPTSLGGQLAPRGPVGGPVGAVPRSLVGPALKRGPDLDPSMIASPLAHEITRFVARIDEVEDQRARLVAGVARWVGGWVLCWLFSEPGIKLLSVCTYDMIDSWNLDCAFRLPDGLTPLSIHCCVHRCTHCYIAGRNEKCWSACGEWCRVCGQEPRCGWGCGWVVKWVGAWLGGFCPLDCGSYLPLHRPEARWVGSGGALAHDSASRREVATSTARLV